MTTNSIPIRRYPQSSSRSTSATLINTSQQIDSLSNEWDQTIAGSSTVMSTTDSILAQSLPPTLAAPRGWHSEILDSSVETNVVQSRDHYQTADVANSSSIVYSSTNNADRVINETPIETQHIIHEQNFGATNQANLHEQRTFVTHNDQAHQYVQQVETEQDPPLVLHRTIPNNKVTYQQNVSVRYLQPPTPPPPGPIIIREVRPPPPRPLTPVKIRQQAPPPPTPPPVVIRERPPPPPQPLPSQVVEKVLPPPPAAPRRMIVERFASCPPKPADVIIERWLPYRRSDRRRILYERAPAPYIPPSEPNLLVLHDQPRARIEKEFINQGVVRADPESYLQRYGAEIHSGYSHSHYSYLVDEAARSVPPPGPLPISPHHYSSSYHRDLYPSYGSYDSYGWDRIRSASPPLPHYSSYYSRYDDPYRSASRYPSDYYHSYDDYHRRSPYRPTMVDVTSTWGRHCGTPLPSHSYLPSYGSRSIRVNSDGELRDVLADLTGGRLPSPYRSY